MTTKKNVDKLIFATSDSASNNVTEKTLFTCTYPVTLSSFRWIINYYNSSTGPVAVYWQLYHLREGYGNIDSIIQAGAWNNAEDVIAYGILACTGSSATTGPQNATTENFTNIKRKFKPGDKLVFLTDATVANSGTVRSIWQTFAKS